MDKVKNKPSEEGRKLDENKVRYDLLPVDGMDEIARVLSFGSKKYGDRNWEKGISYGRLFRAAIHHLWAWWCGEQVDPESGRHPLAHCACCVIFLLCFEVRSIGGGGLDDRPRNTRPLLDGVDSK